MPVPEGLTGTFVNGETLRVREVWAENLGEEIGIIRNIVEEYPYVAMDTEFPGVVARPVGNFKSSREYHYKVGLCLCDVWAPAAHAAACRAGGVRARTRSCSAGGAGVGKKGGRMTRQEAVEAASFEPAASV